MVLDERADVVVTDPLNAVIIAWEFPVPVMS